MSEQAKLEAQRRLSERFRAMQAGWRPCIVHIHHTRVPGYRPEHPSDYEHVEFRRYGEDTSWVGSWKDLHPQMNIASLWWRPWQGEAIDGTIIDVKAEPEEPAAPLALAAPTETLTASDVGTASSD
jgi:hypothetical protein